MMTMTPELGINKAMSSIFLDPDDDELREPAGLFSQVARRIPTTAKNKPARMPQRTEQRVKTVRKRCEKGQMAEVMQIHEGRSEG